MKSGLLLIILVLFILLISSGCTQADRAEQLYWEGLSYNAHADYELALDCFNRSLAINPGSAEVHVARGVALFNMRRFDEADESVDAALRIDPGVAFGQQLKSEIVLARQRG